MNPHLPTLATEPEKPVAGNIKTALEKRRFRVTVDVLGGETQRWNRHSYTKGQIITAEQLRTKVCVLDEHDPDDRRKATFRPETDEELKDRLNYLMSIRAIEPELVALT